VHEFTGFTAPSGNVGCFIDVDYVRRDIDECEWSPPARPADCELDYRQGIALSPGSRPPSCAPATPPSAAASHFSTQNR
jgi:hypothetical protein